VYLPLGGSRTKAWALTILVVFIVSGIWHGAGWNFILWGALWGLMLLVFHVGKKFQLPALLSWSLTLIGAFFAWLCFYETRTLVLFEKITTLLNPMSYSLSHLQAATAMLEPGDAFVLGAFILLALATLGLEWISLRRYNEPYALLKRPVALCILVVLTIWLAPSEESDFIYFAF